MAAGCVEDDAVTTTVGQAGSERAIQSPDPSAPIVTYDQAVEASSAAQQARTDAFGLERRVEPWATDMEVIIDRAYDSTVASRNESEADVQLVARQCAARTCRIEVRYANRRLQEDLYMGFLMATLAPMSNRRSFETFTLPAADAVVQYIYVDFLSDADEAPSEPH